MSDSVLGQPGRGRGCYHWQGRVYHGAKAVAAAAGVSLNTVFRHLRANGNLDGLSAEVAGRYEWQGKFYRRQADVAAAAGTSRSGVSQHLRRHGNLKSLGVGVGRNNSRAPIPGQPVRVGSQKWESISALARVIGVSRPTVKRWLKRGDLERLQARLMAVDVRAAKRGAA
ncbi:hypothetical protein [Paracoccus aminophilus]|uniref:Uncharacterized protein n=1 Tax=Paracoccus aminophilus JCM 7686 TaxID=1367847 RepID=S5YSX1_PARAH|nr:hypothetical protein [Paracoccus aminophilus]AGT08336.1 hypothetical protein JCM7686_1232 [Paracoccus aminophilus JCM 7686]